MNPNDKILVVNNGNIIECESTNHFFSDEYALKKSCVFHYLIEKYSDVNGLKITKNNYVSLISDIEIRTFFEQIFILQEPTPDYNIRFLFLMAFSQQGYNFGQFRLMSHLIKIGYNRENIKIFPLFIKNNKYYYDDGALKNILQEFKPTYVCETSYIGWDKEIIILNKKIREFSNSLIMTGGPFTSSHFFYCQKCLDTDIIFVGHGEYVFEAFLKACEKEKTHTPNIDMIPGVFYANTEYELENVIPVINRYMDFLSWDIKLLYELFKIAPVINVFTSEECKGNCIFCYRVSYCLNNTMSNSELLNRISLIMSYHKFQEIEEPIFLRFFDDDFFAAINRDPKFLFELSKLLSSKLKLYELTFSIRSINRLQKKYGSQIYEAIKSLNLKRVTIGVDGFNDLDLKRLRKGYKMNTVFENIEMLSKNKIPVLMYSILTTYETEKKQLFQSLKNMISLSCLQDVYVGPTITPCIWLHSGNKKLFPKFEGEDVIYLDVNSIDPTQNGYNRILSAQILPKDLFVRKYIKDIGNPTVMESAYIIPLMARFMKQLSLEANFINKVLNNVSYRKRLFDLLCKKKERYNKQLINSKDDIYSINKIHSYKRKINDIQMFFGILSKEKLEQKYKEIIYIINNYIDFCESHSLCHGYVGLSSNIFRLLKLPIQVFSRNLNHVIDCCNLNCIEEISMTEDEYEMFQRLLNM